MEHCSLPQAYLIGLIRPVGCRCWCLSRLPLVRVRRDEATPSPAEEGKGKGSEPRIRPICYELASVQLRKAVCIPRPSASLQLGPEALSREPMRPMASDAERFLGFSLAAKNNFSTATRPLQGPCRPSLIIRCAIQYTWAMPLSVRSKPSTRRGRRRQQALVSRTPATNTAQTTQTA